MEACQSKQTEANVTSTSHKKTSLEIRCVISLYVLPVHEQSYSVVRAPRQTMFFIVGKKLNLLC